MDLPRLRRVVVKGIVVELLSRKRPCLWLKEALGLIDELPDDLEVMLRTMSSPLPPTSVDFWNMIFRPPVTPNSCDSCSVQESPFCPCPTRR